MTKQTRITIEQLVAPLCAALAEDQQREDRDIAEHFRPPAGEAATTRDRLVDEFLDLVHENVREDGLPDAKGERVLSLASTLGIDEKQIAEIDEELRQKRRAVQLIPQLPERRRAAAKAKTNLKVAEEAVERAKQLVAESKRAVEAAEAELERRIHLNQEASRMLTIAEDNVRLVEGVDRELDERLGRGPRR